MGAKTLAVIFTLLMVYNVQCDNPPVIKESFIAWGEIVQPLPETNDMIVLQTTFEESYDANTQNGAFFLYLTGKNLTFFKNSATKQTFLYMETNDTKLQCSETSEKEWMVSDLAPGLLSFEDDDGTVKFSLTQLLNIPDKYMMESLHRLPVDTTYRGMPAKTWIYEIKTKDEANQFDITISIQSYWSDGKWNTSGGQRMIPLGFNVSKMTWSKPILIEDYFISVYGFVLDAYDHKYFEPFQGVVCASRKNTLMFPTVSNIKGISIRSEMALPDYQELRYIDTYFDPVNQFIRIDLERMRNENPIERKSKHYQSEIAIGWTGIVYRFSFYKGETECQVIPFDKYENDLQNLFDIKQDLRKWKMGKIFGLNDTSYVYIGQTTKNDIPCHLFQGIRNDWPDIDSKIQSLWEWCFNINMTKDDVVLFRKDEFGLVNANIIILSDPEGVYKNFRMNHHFYEVKAEDPKVLDSTRFDIGRCFSGKDKRNLQFYLNVKVDQDNKLMYENATSDLTFLQMWKAALYKYTGLQDYSLRISNVRAILDNGKIYIKFTILNAHKDLPPKIYEKEISAFDAEKNLKDNVNKEVVSILYKFEKGKLSTVKAEKHSVSFQIDPKFDPQTMAPPTGPTPSEETTFPFTLATEPDDDKTSKHTARSGNPTESTTASDKTVSDPGKSTTPDDHTITPIPKITDTEYIGHGPGSVAGVAISMLLVGLSIGAGGTFYKFNGLPQCMKR